MNNKETKLMLSYLSHISQTMKEIQDQEKDEELIWKNDRNNIDEKWKNYIKIIQIFSLNKVN